VELVKAKYELLKYAERLIKGGNEEPEGLFNDLVVQILRYNPDPAALGQEPLAYLTTSMHNSWNTRLRRKIHAAEVNLENENGQIRASAHPTIPPDAERLVESHELWGLLSQYKGPLSTREDYLLMAHLSGATNEEIAGKLDTSVEVVARDVNLVKNKVRYRLRTRCFGLKRRGGETRILGRKR
jgi:DNA-directed RNA polymerase specialized sigma24 family protein